MKGMNVYKNTILINSLTIGCIIGLASTVQAQERKACYYNSLNEKD